MSAQIAKLSASDLSKSLSKDHLTVNVEKADLPIENLRISAESPSNSLNNGSDGSTPRSNPSPNNRVGQPKFASDSRSIFDRLTDPSKYTGTHKLRFDASGKGRGIEGRKDTTLSDLSQITRENLRKSLPAGANLASAVAAASNSPSSRRASVTIPKFGTQASKAKFIQIFTNGDVMGTGQRMLIGKNINSWDKFLLECSKTLKLPTGPCKKVYHVTKGEEGNYHKRITKVEDLEDGEIYLGCGAEEISQDKYPKALDQ